MKKPDFEANVWDAHVNRAATGDKKDRLQYKIKPWDLDHLEIAANRIRQGQPVGENYLKGQLKQDLMVYKGLTEEDFNNYRP